jgi:hypothetical protein
MSKAIADHNSCEFKNRKQQLALQRSALSESQWNKYCEKNFSKKSIESEEKIIEYDSPILGKYKKGNMWDFQIIFYPLDFSSEGGLSLTYKFNAYRHITIGEILNNFQKFIKNQQLVLKIIFGQDIFNIIKQYLPNPYVGDNNYLYIHKHVFDSRGFATGCTREKIPNEKTLNTIRTILDPNQDITQINLRLRSKKLEKKQYFKQFIDYSIVPHNPIA